MLFFYIKSIRDSHGINAAKAAEGDALIDVVHFDAVRDVVFHQNVEDLSLIHISEPTRHGA